MKGSDRITIISNLNDVKQITKRIALKTIINLFTMMVINPNYILI